MRPLGTTLAALPAALLLSTALLTGCGSEAEVRSADDTPAATPTTGQTDDQTDGPNDRDNAQPVDYEVLALPSASAAGGSASQVLTPVETPDQLADFVSQFERDELAEEVRAAASTSYDGELWAAVVSLGCDVPPGVTVSEGEAGYLATPDKVAAPLDNCLVPVTTVALVAIE